MTRPGLNVGGLVYWFHHFFSVASNRWKCLSTIALACWQGEVDTAMALCLRVEECNIEAGFSGAHLHAPFSPAVKRKHSEVPKLHGRPMASFSQSSKSMTLSMTKAVASLLANAIRLSSCGRVFTLPRRRIYIIAFDFQI